MSASADRTRGAAWTAPLALALALAAPAASAAAPSIAELVDPTTLRVCADPANLPFSNERGEGFENELAELLADHLGLGVAYTWFPDTIGFIRNTIAMHRCDVIMGIGTGSELVQNTNPYYRSVFALVYRADSGIEARKVNDPALHDARIGVIAQTPPATLLARYGLLKNLVPFRLMVDTRVEQPAREIVEQVAEGILDAGIVWGPLAGYWARQQDVPVVVVPLLEEEAGVRLDFQITMAVRNGDPEWKRTLDRFIRERQDDINAILQAYGVPLLDRQRHLIEARLPAHEGGRSQE